MLQLIGLRSISSIDIREKFSISPGKINDKLKKILTFCEEVFIISTCNRTEIYFNSEVEDEKAVFEIFKLLNWELDLMDFTFYRKGEASIKHLLEVTCGFHSKILGEDQILGQVKLAYEDAAEAKSIKGELQRLVHTAITCGKEFKAKSKLYKIPVSSSSIVVKEALSRGIKSFMLLGFGDVGKAAFKYIEASNYEKLYIAVRNPKSVLICAENEKIQVIPFECREKFYKDVDCLIACTSAPHTIIKKAELPLKPLLIFDLAVPRDVEAEVYSMKNVEILDIDHISVMDDKNRDKRKHIMNESRYIVDNYLNEFIEWQNLREIAPQIKKIKSHGEKVFTKRLEVFKNKKHTKDNEELVEILLKSTSDAYINRAIEVLKEEQLKGSAEECMRIIEKIFCAKN